MTDLNCDLGEQPDHLRRDLALLSLITSANIACGGHAGDTESMLALASAAKPLGVRIGAHPGYPDRANLGRKDMAFETSDLKSEIEKQIRALARVASDLGVELSHVKPHGALYHAAMRDERIARAVADAARAVSPDLALVGLADAPALGIWRSMGLRTLAEAFADRRYEPDGSLRPRTHADALITDPAAAADQALGIVRDHTVLTSDGSKFPLRADTICIHSDTPNSLAIARHVRDALSHASGG